METSNGRFNKVDRSLQMFKLVTVKRVDNPFKRGILRFDDFNYAAFNKGVITVSENKGLHGDYEIGDLESLNSLRSGFFSEDGGDSDQEDKFVTKKKKGKKKKAKKLLEEEKKANEDKAKGKSFSQNVVEEEEDEDEEDSFTQTEVEDIYADQKDDPFMELVEDINQAKIDYMQLNTKIPVQSFVDGMAMLQAPTIPRSKTGSNPPREDESDQYNMNRRGSQHQIRLKNNDEMDSKHGLCSIDLYGASIIEIGGVGDQYERSLMPSSKINLDDTNIENGKDLSRNNGYIFDRNNIQEN